GAVASNETRASSQIADQVTELVAKSLVAAEMSEDERTDPFRSAVPGDPDQSVEKCERPRWVICESASPWLLFNKELGMPGARLPMRKIRDMLRLTAAGMSSRKIAASLSIGGTTVVDCLQRARAVGVGWPLPEDLSDVALEARLFPASTALAAIKSRRTQAEWPAIHRELKRPGVTL